MKEQPEALSMADMLDDEAIRTGDQRFWKAAGELRRLHAENGELLEALKRIVAVDVCSALTKAEADEIQAKARAAIARAEGEKE